MILSTESPNTMYFVIIIVAKKHAVDAMLMTGDSYDCGKKMGYMQAFVKYGLRNIMLGTKFRGKIEEIIINDF